MLHHTNGMWLWGWLLGLLRVLWSNAPALEWGEINCDVTQPRLIQFKAEGVAFVLGDGVKGLDAGGKSVYFL